VATPKVTQPAAKVCPTCGETFYREPGDSLTGWGRRKYCKPSHRPCLVQRQIPPEPDNGLHRCRLCGLVSGESPCWLCRGEQVCPTPVNEDAIAWDGKTYASRRLNKLTAAPDADGYWRLVACWFGGPAPKPTHPGGEKPGWLDRLLDDILESGQAEGLEEAS
jgi:hypothetical protein